MVIGSMFFLVYVGDFYLHLWTLILLGFICFVQTISGMAFGFLITALCPTRDQVKLPTYIMFTLKKLKELHFFPRQFKLVLESSCQNSYLLESFGH